jgi:hypothetical protein
MPAVMMKFSSVEHSESLGACSRNSSPSPPADAPQADDIIFEIGVTLAVHLALALVVTLWLRDCTSC